MQGDMTLTIIFGVIGLIVLAVIIYYIMRFLKGSVKLSLEKTDFGGGETIKGSFILNAKQEVVSSALTAALIGYKKTTYYENDERKTRSSEFYNKKITIESSKTYEAGFNQEYNFELPTPNFSNSNRVSHEDLPDKVKDVVSSDMLDMASSAINMLSDKDVSYNWKVEVRVDATGVDLLDTQKVYVN